MNKLKGSRVYLAGPIDRASDFTKWRNDLKPILKEMGLIVIDPCDKPVIGYDETEDFILEKRKWKKNREFYKIIEQRAIRKIDLRMIDSSDLIIVYLDMTARPFGTIEEIVIANLQRKPILVWLTEGLENCPDWLMWLQGSLEHLFESRDDLVRYLHGIDQGILMNKKFVFFDQSKLV